MNLLHKVLYFVLNHKNLVYYLNKTYFGSKIVQDILSLHISQIQYGSALATGYLYLKAYKKCLFK